LRIKTNENGDLLGHLVGENPKFSNRPNVTHLDGMQRRRLVGGQRRQERKEFSENEIKINLKNTY
jgi:hypothetical protein